MALNVQQFLIQIVGKLTKAIDLDVAPEAAFKIKKELALTTGTGAGQADQIFTDRRTLPAGTSEDLDLAGTLINALGDVITFARVKGIIVIADGTNPNNLVVGNAATNPFVGPFGSAVHTHSVRPGGFYAWGCTDATGYVVTATTADLLRILAGAGGNHIYDIVIVGASA
jgi:hypothetical protein